MSTTRVLEILCRNLNLSPSEKISKKVLNNRTFIDTSSEVDYKGKKYLGGRQNWAILEDCIRYHMEIDSVKSRTRKATKSKQKKQKRKM
jgi:hypothetical protein